MTVALAGRRIDAPDADEPRFPPSAVPAVRAAIQALFEAEGARALVCSAACGADLIALDVAGERGLRRRVVMHTDPASFRAESVVDRPDPAHDWGALFDQVIAEVEATGDLVVLNAEAGTAGYVATTEALYSETNRLGEGTPLAVVVWEGASRGPDDLTARFADGARTRGWRVAEVSPRPQETP